MKHILLFSSILIIIFSSCRFVEGRRVRGDGHVITQQRSITGFSGVETHGSINLEVSQGDFKVVVESDENIIPEIVTEVQGGRLLVHFTDGFNSFSYTNATVYITAPDLNAFETHGSGNIESKGTINTGNKAEINVSGSGDITLSLHSPQVTSETYGSGNVTLSGETKDFSASISGSGDVHAFDLKAENVETSTHGSGNTEVYSSVKLTSEIYGSGDITYKGNPQISTQTHGSGAVSSAN
ncbi:MAG: head GIN domain-containing protein [Chitinophagaceae bacterium]